MGETPQLCTPSKHTTCIHSATRMVHKFNVKGATIGLEGRNLFVFGSSYKNYLDPESMGNLYSTPVAKSVTFNLNLKLLKNSEYEQE